MALNFIYESGIPCPSDKAETYKKLKLFELIESMPASWDDMMFLGGDPETSATIARRNGEDWYVSSICSKPQTAELSLDFLGDGEYVAYVYKDAQARWDIDFEILKVTKEDKLTIPMKENGGYTLKIVKEEPELPKTVALSKEELQIENGTSANLEVNYTPDRSKYIAIEEWTSSNDEIVSVDANGVLTANKLGTAYITAKVSVPYQGAEAIDTKPCKVTVIRNKGYQITDPWTRERPNPKFNVNSENSITLYPLNGEMAPSGNTTKNFLSFEVGTMDEDFVVTTKCDFAPTGNFMSAGITATLNTNRYTGIWRRYHKGFGGNIFEGIKLDGKFSEPRVADTTPEETSWLKLEKKGNIYTSYFSYDNENWVQVAEQELIPNEGEVLKISIMCCAGANTPDTDIPATFEDFTYNGKTIAFAGKDVKELQIVDVQKSAEIRVEKGTKADDLKLPAYVSVELENGQTTDVAVAWSYDGYQGEKDGRYELKGILEVTDGLTNQNQVEASVVVIVGNGLPYKDVADTDWFCQDVVRMYENGLMTGVDEETFAPSRNLTRDQFAVILWRLEGSPEVEYTQEFPDVPEGLWYTDAVLWASGQEIARGYADTGLFGPADPISRGQIAVMLYRYAKNKGYDVSETAEIGSYKDAADVPEYAEEAMQWAVGAGIITGKEEQTLLDPQGNANRAEAAAVIFRFMQKYEK